LKLENIIQDFMKFANSILNIINANKLTVAVCIALVIAFLCPKISAVNLGWYVGDYIGDYGGEAHSRADNNKISTRLLDNGWTITNTKSIKLIYKSGDIL
jgi:hypothetical protein